MLVLPRMPVSALQTWLRVQALVWLPACAALPWIAGDRWWAPWWAAGMGGSYLALVRILRTGSRPADAVTIARFVGLLLLVVEGAGRFDPGLWAIAVVVVLLDLVDGAVARRFGGSPQGAVFDMETDQFAVLTLAAIVVAAGGGAHVLILPAMRYVFVLAMWLVGAPAHDPKPVDGDNRRGKLVCAAVMVALLIAAWPGLHGVVRDVATALACGLLAWSFSADARFLVAHRLARRSP